MNKIGCMLIGALLLWGACGSEVSSTEQVVDLPDAGSGGDEGAGTGDEGDLPGENPDPNPVPRDCTVDLPTEPLNPLLGGTTFNLPIDPAQPDGTRLLQLTVRIANAREPLDGPVGDFLRLEWYPGQAGVDGFQTGTFILSGVDTDITDCTQCVFLLGDVNLESGQPTQVLMAESGTLSIAAVDATPDTGILEGVLSNVTFREVTIDGETQTVVANGCRTTLTEFEFETSVVAQ